MFKNQLRQPTGLENYKYAIEYLNEKIGDENITRFLIDHAIIRPNTLLHLELALACEDEKYTVLDVAAIYDVGIATVFRAKNRFRNIMM